MTAKELLHLKTTIEELRAEDPQITDIIINYQIIEAKQKNIANIKINR
tara:strand:- start:49 stop:192 length:144 start_codon:yes stop_codon:yes gene_type:complete